MDGAVKKLVLVVKGMDTGGILERWAFDCESTNSKKNKNSRFAIFDTYLLI